MSHPSFDILKQKAERPWVISGPCSAETEEQTLETCRQLAASKKVHALRAGLWKPRTRLGSFEGVKEEGLPWLIKAGQQTGLPVMTEVARAEHVGLCVDAGVDMLWIGARTTVSPFTIQDISDALAECNVDIPVFVKNPVNADLELWLGAIERIEAAGISQVAAIHRGFSQYASSAYRNPPNWQIALALRERRKDIPLICDPSHMGGRRELIQPLSQQSLDLLYDGLMIEAHISPDEALSDARQQVTPERLLAILDQLVVRKEKLAGNDSEELARLRDQIDDVDRQLIEALSRRMKVSEDIGEWKKSTDLSPYQPQRWEEIRMRLIEIAKAAGLSEGFISGYLSALHQESIDHQFKVMYDQTVAEK